jgi:Flp pilus assembly protein TadD
VRIEAARLLVGVDPGVLDPGERDRLAMAVGEYVDAQQASLDRPAAWLNLGNLHAEAGDAERARAHYRAALALDPAFEPALGNLADLLFRQGDDLAAGQVLAYGLDRLPDSAVLHHARGLHQVRSGDRTAALASLARAVELAPDDPQFRYVHAIALHGEGRHAEAIAGLERAHALREADQDILRALISLQLEAGDVAAARVHARKLQRLTPWNARLEALLAKRGDEVAAEAQ